MVDLGSNPLADLLRPAAALTRDPDPQGGMYGRSQRHGPGDGDDAGDTVPATRDVHDVAVIMGIPAADLTPEVEAALTGIMTELDHIRMELDHARAAIALLEDQVAGHPVLDVMNRAALLKQLKLLIGRAERTDTANSFVILHLYGVGAIRRRLDLAAAEGAMARAVAAIKGQVQATDLIGSLGGYDLGVVLTVMDTDAAAARARAMVEAVSAVRAPGDETLGLSAWAGVGAFAATVGEILAAADKNLSDSGGAPPVAAGLGDDVGQ